MMESTAYLIRETYIEDSISQRIPKEEKIKLLCHTESIRQNEFFEAGRNGIKADLLIVTQAVNYNNEKILEYDGERYGIYRTYRRPSSDEIEIYAQWKGGIDNHNETDDETNEETNEETD